MEKQTERINLPSAIGGIHQMGLHAVLFPYTDDRSLQRALKSLTHVQHALNCVTVLRREEQRDLPLHTLTNSLSIPVTTHFLNGDWQRTPHLPHEPNDIFLFLHDEDFVSTPLPDIVQAWPDHLEVVTCPSTAYSPIYKRSLLVRAQTYEAHGAHFGHLLYSDSEAGLAACLSQLEPHQILHLDVPIVRQTRRRNSRFYPDRIAYLTHLSSAGATSSDLSLPTVGVLLAAYQASTTIDTALSSLASQRVSASEILMVDDGSQDDTAPRIETWLPKLQNARLIRAPENQGKAQALNMLVPYISSDFVMELDADDWLDPFAIATIQQLVSQVSLETSLLYGNFRVWIKRMHTLQLAGVNRGRQVYQPRELLTYPLPLGPRIYRTSALKAIGGFPVPTFADGRLYEDVLVTRNLMRQGAIRYEDFTVYNVLRHADSITRQHQHAWSRFVELYQRDFHS
ncbi:glycosyltransferase family 2 protein [Alicyclobacillus suci]|uniref:glycosyltransferase family 2 protein n=1 Tax=Alicyclobacillus suci TaxID=2816080 RepID=UPI001A90773D|nr:glycosyltransferase [Alicyclobacillus suci]